MTAPLEDILRAHIVAHGPMDVGAYMSLCLLHPEHGYYITRDPFGASGDFVTAPEISPLFGEMIGFWVADMWGQMGSPARWHLVELGPGRGTLMIDILRILSQMNGCAPTVHLIEASAKLRAVQRNELADRCSWHDDINAIPTDAPIIVVNNEFFDALPVRQYIKTADGIDEAVIGVCLDGRLQLGRVRASISLPDDFPMGRVVEISPARDNVAGQIYERIKNQGGAMLAIDYGYDQAPGASTLQAVRSHQKVNVLSAPGACDLTALVDFARLRALAVQAGLAAYGPVGQGAFLLQLGIAARLAKNAAQATKAQHDEMLMAMDRLCSPEKMGDLFKVLCVCQASPILTPAGFS